jgi:D-alanyl-D-alanine carboxypeptidase
MHLAGTAGLRESFCFRSFCRLMLVALVIALATAVVGPASALAKPRFSAIAVDARTGNVLFSRDADGIRHPASLTKVMTLYLLFEDLTAGRLKLDSPLRVSKRAAGMAPSKLGLKPGSSITVDQAIRALVTKSANDVAATVAENLGGSESAFATRMTSTARRLGMSRTVFRNASGLPDPAQVTTARDMATLSLRIQRDFPKYYPYFKITAFNFKGRVIRTHNRLLGRFAGTDGIKTGYIRASGFNLTTSAQRGSKRIVGVVMGSQSASARNNYMMAMLDQAFPKCKDGNAIVAAISGGTKALAAEADQPAASPVTERLKKGKTVSASPRPAESSPMVEEVGDAEPSIGEDEQTALGAMLDEDTAEATPLPPPAGKIPFEVKTANAAAEGWHIQVAASPSKDDAISQISKARQSAARLLADKQAITIEVQAGSGTMYRARFIGFSERTASQACRSLKAKGLDCLVLAPQG